MALEEDNERAGKTSFKKTTPAGDQAHNPGTCPDLGSNQRPLGAWNGAQSLSHTGGVTITFYYLTRQIKINSKVANCSIAINYTKLVLKTEL